MEFELGMASMRSNSSSSEKRSSGKKKSGSKSKIEELVGQERRTRIAFLENQQAELETEIRLLNQNENAVASKLCANTVVPVPGSDDEPLRERLSSGMGDSLESNNNPELDALSRMVVDRVLERIKSDDQVAKNNNGHQASKNNALKAVEEEKSGMAVTQMRYLLQRERNFVSELQAS